MLNRFYQSRLSKQIVPNKVLVIYGPRRVGKTTLVENFLKSYSGNFFKSSGEDAKLREVLESSDFAKIIPFFSDYDLVFIDEAQKINNVGQGLKILVDQIPNIRIIATGSSSFALSSQVGEPLVGRQKILKLYPLSIMELRKEYGTGSVEQNLENWLIFGSYPEVVTQRSFKGKIDYLETIRDSYLYKDILELENVRNSRKIYNLLRLIAFQIGNEVSYQELGTQLSMSKNTVIRYLDLLEKSFVLINVGGFSRNLRKEISKTSRYYFYDNGVRNSIIGNFNQLDGRNDIGQLWENFLFIERMKKREYLKMYGNYYFWRTYDKKEIDLIEERGGKLFAYEFKWGKKAVKAPEGWLETYKNSSYKVINQENYLSFVS